MNMARDFFFMRFESETWLDWLIDTSTNWLLRVMESLGVRLNVSVHAGFGCVLAGRFGCRSRCHAAFRWLLLRLWMATLPRSAICAVLKGHDDLATASERCNTSNAINNGIGDD